MRLGFYFSTWARRSAASFSLTVFSLATVPSTLASCTLTTNLDFVGPGTKPASNQDASVAPTRDAGTSAPDALLDAEVPSLTTPTPASGSTTTPPLTVADASDASSDAGDAGDPSPPDADVYPNDGASLEDPSDSEPTDAGDTCIAATPLLSESYEGDLTQWSAVTWQRTECQQTDVAAAIALDSTHAVRSRIQCQADTDHLHYTTIRLSGDAPDTQAPGVDAPNGLLLSFAVWLSAGYDFDADTWLDFVRFSGACDRTDDPLAVGLNESGRYLTATRPQESDALTRVQDAPRLPLTTWARVDIYVNYTEGSLAVWQDGSLVTTVLFQRSAPSLCLVDFGTMASRVHSDLVTFHDDVRLSRLNTPLRDLSKPPELCAE